MALDVVHARLQVAVALRQVHLQQVPQQVLQVGPEVGREADLARNDLLVDLNRLVGEERRVPGGHLVHQHTQRPPVDGFVVTLTEDDLRGEVLGRTAQRPCAALHSLGEAEIRHLQVTLRVDQEVLRLQVPVDQIQVVEVLESEHDLSGIETRMGLGEAADLAQVREHLATGHVLQHHVEVRIVFEVKPQADEEGEGDRLQDALLVEGVLDLLELHHLLFVEYFHRVVLLGGLVLNDHDAAKGPRA